jgi:plasmid stabilization system protein ParE
MKVSFHRRTQYDVWEVVRHYEEESGEILANQFHAEFMRRVAEAATNPERCHIDPSGLRRCNLKRFPYHFLFRVRRDDIFVLVLRHDRRHAGYGLRRS